MNYAKRQSSRDLKHSENERADLTLGDGGRWRGILHFRKE